MVADREARRSFTPDEEHAQDEPRPGNENEDLMEQNSKLSFKREVEALQAIRDELKVKAHLAKAEIKDEWSQLEGQLNHLEEELLRTADHVKEPLHAIGHPRPATSGGWP